MTDILQNGWKRVGLGLLFIFAGVLFGWLAENSDSIVKSICGDTLKFWCFPVRLALLDLGLKGLAYTLIVIGVILTVLYSYVAELLGSILSFALVHVANSKKVVVDAMERGSVSRDDSSTIIVEVISRYMGYYDKNSHSFANFMIEKFIKQVDVDNGFWRRDYHAVIKVDELYNSDKEAIGGNYLRWNETNSFTVENEISGKMYPYKSAMSVEVFDSTDEKTILQELRYEVRAGGALIFSYDTHKARLVSHNFDEGDYTGDGLTVSTSGGDISIKVQKDVVVEHRSIDFVVDEESLISKSDTTFELCFQEPTKRFHFRFHLPDGYNIFHHGYSGRKFGSSVSDKVISSQPGENRVRLDVHEWCLPGIATVLAWKTT